VLPEHSTFELITQHAQRVKVHMNTQPPAQECQLDCWVPAKSAFGMLRRCVSRRVVDVAGRRLMQDAGGACLPARPSVEADQATVAMAG
jgi:hypothetical protein